MMGVLMNAMAREAGKDNTAFTSKWPSLKDFIVPSTLYFNPEWDFLAFSAWPNEYKGHLVGQFLSDRFVFDMSMVIPELGVSVMHGR